MICFVNVDSVGKLLLTKLGKNNAFPTGKLRSGCGGGQRCLLSAEQRCLLSENIGASSPLFPLSVMATKNILIVTHYTYELLPYARFFEAHMKPYCAYHGYDFLAIKRPTPGGSC